MRETGVYEKIPSSPAPFISPILYPASTPAYAKATFYINKNFDMFVELFVSIDVFRDI